MLHIGLRVADLERALSFYGSVGFETVGEVPETSHGHLTMLKLPGDEFVSIELVSDSPESAPSVGSGLNHLVIQVESLEATLADLSERGIEVDAPSPPESPDDIGTAWITDPDGNRIELVEWPAGHPDGMTAGDF